MKSRTIHILLGTACTLALTFSANATWITEWQAGAPGRGQPLDGVGGGPDVDFVQEGGGATPAPGDPNSPAVAQMADDDYYFAGIYPNPIGTVINDEIAFERAFTAGDPNLRIHFNLPMDPLITSSTLARFSIEPWSLQTGSGGTPFANARYSIAATFNGVEILPLQTILEADLAQTITSPVFDLASVSAGFGPGADNVIQITGTKDGDSNWVGFDYHALELNVIPEPQTFGLLICGVLVLCLGKKRRG